jgi:mycothiol synthase
MAQLLMRRPHLHNIPRTSMPEGYASRTADPDGDESALAEVLSAAFREPWTVQMVRERLTRAMDVKAVCVVTWRGAVVATASSRWVPDRFPGEGYVHWVGTHPEHTRKGLASYMLARLFQDFTERGYQSAVLETDDFRLPAVRTYLKMGFTPVYAVGEEDHRERWCSLFQILLGTSEPTVNA